MAEFTPMMQQYRKIKAMYPDTILFYRLGDFYEMFFEDAKTASRELELVLTGRDCGMEERAPMCGVPFHAAEGYIARLVAKGYKVAICEQTEDPAKAKGLVTRDVIRIVTPGTVTESSMLPEDRCNYLACLYTQPDAVGMAFVEVSTGEVQVAETHGAEAYSQAAERLSVFAPTEIRANPMTMHAAPIKNYVELSRRVVTDTEPEEAFDFDDAKQVLEDHFHKSLEAIGIAHVPAVVPALAAALRYLYKTQKNDLENITEVRLFRAERTMSLSATTRANLELTESFRRREKKGSLLWVLDRTRTAMGKRKLRAFVEQPLRSVSDITYRQNGVEELYADPILRDDLVAALSNVQDFERIATRIVYGSANAKELRGLYAALQAVPALKALLAGVRSNILKKIRDQMEENAELSALIDRAIVEDPPFSLREGGFIRAGYNEELDSLRDIVSGGRDFLMKIEREEQEKTGIKKLRIGYNKVFGYYIEILNTYRELVPDYYIRKQTLTNCERYITPELKELEAKVLTARERIEKLEYDLFCEVRAFAAERQQSLRDTGDLIATLDAVCSLAQVAADNGYVRPVVDLGGVVDIKEGRHPVVEKYIGDMPFVPNDTYLDRDKNRTLIITGPNMAGKSTYMRQTALIVLMAQIGSFVPAKEATIGVVDAIYTRIGASDDLAAGQSTFMTEMSEVAAILENATDESLVILDEIGRGTSTYDGMAIARAVLEYINARNQIGCKTLFATHYHELTEMGAPDSGYKNLNCAVKKRGDDIFFLRKIAEGPADGSYGIQVAKIAGVPDKVVRRAKAILKDLEKKEIQSKLNAASGEELDLDLVAALSGEPRVRAVMRDIQEMNINELTPFEALAKLYELQKKLETGS